MKHPPVATAMNVIVLLVGLQWGCGDDSGGGGSQDAALRDASMVQDAALGDSSVWLDAALEDATMSPDARGDATAGGACVGTCARCTRQGNENSCGAVVGCRWVAGGHCSGTCTTCDSIPVNQCTDQDGCSQTQILSCEGDCIDCSRLLSEASCQSQDGCGWSGQCFPTGDCSSWTDGDTCTNVAGCSWMPGLCMGNGQCRAFEDEVACRNVEGCRWSGLLGCDGIFDCSAVATDESTCTDLSGSGCNWIQGRCSGLPDCSYETMQSCENSTGACQWILLCSGTCTDCSTFTDENACQGQDGCVANAVDACRGDCTSCDGLSVEADCIRQDGCSWTNSVACTGICQSCETFTDETECDAQPGCQWQ